VTNLQFDTEILNRIKVNDDEITPYIKKWAVVGVKGLLRLGYDIAIRGNPNSPYKLLDSEQEALDWLVV
jgi:hypothetical protein